MGPTLFAEGTVKDALCHGSVELSTFLIMLKRHVITDVLGKSELAIFEAVETEVQVDELTELHDSCLDIPAHVLSQLTDCTGHQTEVLLPHISGRVQHKEYRTAGACVWSRRLKLVTLIEICV